jgi:hypothetical protein
MSEESMQTFTYRILRYTPNLIRDEWVNIGVLLHEPERNQLRVRLIEEPHEFARIRRLHPTADESLLRALSSDFGPQLAAFDGDAAAFLTRLEDTLSNLLQLSPQRAVLSEDAAAELERLYQAHVEPPRFRGRAAAEMPDTRAGIRARAAEVFRRAGILQRMDHAVRIEGFTFKGDPLRIDFGYRMNGTNGFAHSIALARDLRQAKEFAFTADCIRSRQPKSEFCAITEAEPRREDERHAFVAELFAAQEIQIVPTPRLDEFAQRLRARLQ